MTIQTFLVPLGAQILNIIAAVLVLLIGWIIARIISGAIAGLIRRTGLHDRMNGWFSDAGVSKNPDSASVIGSIVFWVIMIFVIIAFLQVLSLSFLATILQGFLAAIFLWLPRLFAAALLALVAWIVATLLRTLTVRLLTRLHLGERAPQVAAEVPPENTLATAIGEVVYWLVWLLFLPGIVGLLGLVGLLGPVQNLVDEVLRFLPRLFAAAIILIIGLFVARILRRITESLLAGLGLDRLGERVGIGRQGGATRPSAILGLVVYILVLVPIILAALDAVGLPALTVPISNMLNAFLAAVPAIFAAVVILALAWVIGRLVANLVSDLLASIGFDSLPAKLGLGNVSGSYTPSRVVGQLVLAAFMVLAAMQAAAIVGWAALTILISGFLVFAARVILGLIIIALGLWLANLAAQAILASGSRQARLFATGARVAILFLAIAMGLRQMGVADEIINLGFGLVLAALALAFGLAFGLGNRETAGREVNRWLADARSAEPPPPPPAPTEPPPPRTL